MIIGIGIDLVSISRIEAALERWGDNFKKRIFSPVEITYSESHKSRGQHFAASFAVKEAFFKAIGSSSKSHHIRMLDIEVARGTEGKPYINVYGGAKRAVEQVGIQLIHTSISHDGEYSVAVVILEK